jgi:ribonuclease HI
MPYNKIYINCDGGSRGNPGPAAIGIAVWDESHKKIDSHKECVGITTNNVAEYNSLIAALKVAGKHTAKEVHIIMDSELVIRQMNGTYKVKKPHLLGLHRKAKELEKDFEKVVYANVAREDRYQAEADRLVNEALDGV